jgi:hypothetical protein
MNETMPNECVITGNMSNKNEYVLLKDTIARKKCLKCEVEKSLSEFYKDPTMKAGYRSSCKVCSCKYANGQYKNDREMKCRQSREWRRNNRSRARSNCQKWYQNHRREYIEYILHRRKTNPNEKLRHRLRTRLSDALRGNKKVGSAVSDLGCSIPEFKSYIESKFSCGMTWSNYGNEWHLDHIIPLSKFDLTERDQLLIACHYSNYQPLWKHDNLSKGDLHVLDFKQGMF